MVSNTKGVVAFVLLAYGLAWTLWEAVLLLGLPADNPVFQLAILPGAMAPAAAAVVVRKWVTREGFADAGFRLNLVHWRYYAAGWTMPLFVVTAIVLLTVAFGVSDPDFTLDRALRELAPEGTEVFELPTGIFAVVVVQVMVSAVFVTPILFGEEFGWRGYLQPRLFCDRPLLGAVATGIIWSLWHLPINLRGYNFPDDPLLGMCVFTGSAIMLSIIFGWLRARTGSIWAASLGHSATNAIGGGLTLFLFLGAPNWLFVSYVGILGWVPLGAICVWIVLTGQLDGKGPGQAEQTTLNPPKTIDPDTGV
ncbi:MAG: CPBP family intramembrane metalloprotease [Chloroflexi bacterium]|nr:CPBP family intramembrane metalloprotease [Chloroflexota bacterium]